MKSNQRFSLSVIAVTVVVVGLTAGTIPGAQADEQIIPVNANAYGNTYGEWSARWWQWLLSIPMATNPNFDTTGANCAQKQAGPVWFLAGTFVGGSAVTRSCTVPAGKALFFPILNSIFGAGAGDCDPTNPGVLCNLADLRVATAATLDSVTLTASIDDESLENLRQQRVQSPVFTITYPAGAVFRFNAGTDAPNVSDGYWLMVPPLHAGKHTIHIKGVFTGGPLNGTVIEVTDHLTVQGAK